MQNENRWKAWVLESRVRMMDRKEDGWKMIRGERGS